MASEPVQATLGKIAGKTEGPVVEGEADWLFLRNGVASYAAPSIWPGGESPGSDPLDVIADFDRMLDEVGIELIVVPVPGKPAIYPDKLGAGLAPDALIGGPHEAFVELLAERGVTVIDLAPALRELRAAGIAPFARQDSHWSPEGMELAVDAVVRELADAEWLKEFAHGKASESAVRISALGDLVTMGDLEGYEPETFTIAKVEPSAGAVEDESSPVVLIGDSHLLVYHQPINGGIDASGAGFPDRFFAKTGIGGDLVANQGGGINLPRARLARRRDDQANLAGKKVVVWVFASRDLTETARGWVPIPVIR